VRLEVTSGAGGSGATGVSVVCPAEVARVKVKFVRIYRWAPSIRARLPYSLAGPAAVLQPWTIRREKEADMFNGILAGLGARRSALGARRSGVEPSSCSRPAWRRQSSRAQRGRR